MLDGDAKLAGVARVGEGKRGGEMGGGPLPRNE